MSCCKSKGRCDCGQTQPVRLCHVVRWREVSPYREVVLCGPDAECVADDLVKSLKGKGYEVARFTQAEGV